MKKNEELIENKDYLCVKYRTLERIHFKFLKLSRQKVAVVREYLHDCSRISFYHERDIIYDIEEIRDNARKAVQSMEQRSLDLILKRLINEEFKW